MLFFFHYGFTKKYLTPDLPSVAEWNPLRCRNKIKTDRHCVSVQLLEEEFEKMISTEGKSRGGLDAENRSSENGIRLRRRKIPRHIRRLRENGN